MAKLLEIAGEYCGLSPTAAHKGFGRFDIEFDPEIVYLDAD